MKVNLINDAEDHITEAALRQSAANLVDKGSVLIVTRSGILRHTLPVAVTSRQVALNQDLKALTPYPGVVPEYVAWALRWAAPRILSQCSKGGTTVQSVETPQLLRFVIPIAPTAEQYRIVAGIEEQISRIDAGVALLEGAQMKLLRMRSAIFESGVRARDRTNGEDLPKGWRINSLGEVAEVSGGITKNPARKPRENAVPFLRVANVHRDSINLSEVHLIEVFPGELERLRLRPGDLLVVEGNGSPDQIGRSALWRGEIDPCVHQNHLIRIRPGEQVVPEYLNLYWNAPSSARVIQAAASSTSGLHTLSTGKVRSIPVLLPPLDVQSRIVEQSRNQFSFIDGLAKDLTAQLSMAARLRSAILAAAFSGELTTQESTDEPASLLIERTASRNAAPSRTLTTSRKHQRHAGAA